MSNIPAKKIKSTAKKSAVNKTIVAPTVVVAPAPAPKAAAPKAPALKATVIKTDVPAAKVTTIIAKVDIGFGNSLFLRGTGPGLSWEKGVELTNIGSDEWTWSTSKATEDFLAKVLINDVIWSGDPDTTVVAGTKTTISATF
jgi:hypothetical protein